MNSKILSISINRRTLLALLQLGAGIVDRKSSMPILSNALFSISPKNPSETQGNKLMLDILCSDTEIEIKSTIEAILLSPNNTNIPLFTIPHRKFLDICRSLLDEEITMEMQNDTLNRVNIVAKNSKYTLSGLQADTFPIINSEKSIVEFFINQRTFKNVLSRTAIAIPVGESRNYLNGMLLDVSDCMVKAIASDTVKLAFNCAQIRKNHEISGNDNGKESQSIKIIVPKKTVSELAKILEDKNSDVKVCISENYIHIETSTFEFCSKIFSKIRMPNYDRILTFSRDENILIINRDFLKNALFRLNIVAGELLRRVLLKATNGTVHLYTDNTSYEEAMEEIPSIEHKGSKLEAFFNIDFFTEIVNNINNDKVLLKARAEGKNGMIVRSYEEDEITGFYILMPYFIVKPEATETTSSHGEN